jgi:transposase
MPAPLQVRLTEVDRAALETCFDTTREAETRLRAQMVLLAAQGYTVPQIAPLVRRDATTVQRVLHRYQAEGVAGVPHRRRPGRPSPVPAAWEAELRRVIELDPHTVGVASANWTTRLLAAYLSEQTGYHASLETVRVHLHQAGYVCKRPTWTLQRRAEAEPGWAKNA